MDYAINQTGSYGEVPPPREVLENMMQQAAAQKMGGPQRDRKPTPIDEAVERIQKIAGGVDEMRRRLDRNADRIFGHVPEPVCGPDLSGMAMQSEPPLMDALLSAVSRLESELSGLAAATERNCWAV